MSSGGYSSPDPAPGPGACGRLSYATTVTSVDPGIASTLAEGDLLDVVLVGTAPTRRVELHTDAGEVLGSVTENLVQLAICLADGWSYQAEVLRVGPPFRVRIEPR